MYALLKDDCNIRICNFLVTAVFKLLTNLNAGGVDLVECDVFIQCFFFVFRKYTSMCRYCIKECVVIVFFTNLREVCCITNVEELIETLCCCFVVPS